MAIENERSIGDGKIGEVKGAEDSREMAQQNMVKRAQAKDGNKA